MSKSNQVYGARIGSYLGKPIFESIKNTEGEYLFDRIARCVDNEYPLDQLDRNEVLLEPGLIYKQAS